MIGRFGQWRHPAHEREGLSKVGELEAAAQRTVAQLPSGQAPQGGPHLVVGEALVLGLVIALGI